MQKVSSSVKKAASHLGLTNAGSLGAKGGKVKTAHEKMKELTKKKAK